MANLSQRNPPQGLSRERVQVEKVGLLSLVWQLYTLRQSLGLSVYPDTRLNTRQSPYIVAAWPVAF